MAVVRSASGVRYPNNQATDSPSIVTAMSAAVVDLDPIMVPHFTTLANADTAFSAMKNGTGVYAGDARSGICCTIGSPATLYMWDGTRWVADAARRVSYDGSKIFSGVHPGTDSALGGFPDAGGFLGHAAGLTVPEDGVYSVTLTAFISPGAKGRTYLTLTGASAFAQVYIPNTSTGWPFDENRATVSYNAITMGAGSVIGVLFGHNNVGDAQITVRLTAIKVSS
jgi:hypothetical protein